MALAAEHSDTPHLNEEEEQGKCVEHAVDAWALLFPEAHGHFVVARGSALALPYCCTIDPSAI